MGLPDNPSWDEKRGWAYLIWEAHLSRRPADHRSSGHPCDACRIAAMLNLGPWDKDRLLAQSPGATAPVVSPGDTNVIPFRGRGA